MKIDVLLMRYNKNELSTQLRRYDHEMMKSLAPELGVHYEDRCITNEI